jgi:nucleolar complex protein 3
VVQSSTASDAAGSRNITRTIAGHAVTCMCGLLTAHPHFNFRANLVQAVVPRMDHTWPEISSAAYDCIVQIFKTDLQGELALEVTKAVAKYAKDKKYAVHERVLRCLSLLPLKVHEDEVARVRSVAKARGRKRRAQDVDAELMESEAQSDPAIRARCHADALQEVTLTYFRVLKQHRTPALLPAVMEGLAKFAHLINLDTVEDLLALLRTLLQEDKLTFEASLHCVLMAFRTLQGPGRELQIDDKDFLQHLYRQLPKLIDSANRGYVPLALECIDVAFIKRREHSPTRSAAFLKRLLSLALHFTYDDVKALLGAAHAIALRYPTSRQLLENEQDRAAVGTYDALMNDPEHANPFATSCWELSLLKFSYHTDIVKSVDEIQSLIVQDPAEAVAAAYLRAAKDAGTSTSIFSGVRAPNMQAAKPRLGSKPVFPRETIQA